MNRRAQGTLGEEQALAYLVAHGMTEVARNVRAAGGEIDLVMRDGRYLVFVEVKLRTDAHMGLGREAVDARKRARISRAALSYLVSRGSVDVPVRFDVVEIQAGDVHHIPAAFDFAP